jgi:hypothetical protein
LRLTRPPEPLHERDRPRPRCAEAALDQGDDHDRDHGCELAEQPDAGDHAEHERDRPRRDLDAQAGGSALGPWQRFIADHVPGPWHGPCFVFAQCRLHYFIRCCSSRSPAVAPGAASSR